jgi:phosphocarrier protein HPr
MVINKHGLHARPVTQFVQLANQFQSKIEVSNGDLAVDGKSVMSMLRLAAAKGTTLEIKASGTDSTVAVGKLVGLVESKFGEE